jgi:RNA polymerase sigma-70 factor (ECF subfamily)
MERPTTGEALSPRDLREQFEFLFASNRQRLFGYIVACLHRRQDAEEVFGETTLILWREFPKFRQDSEFMPWAAGIAFNQIRKYRRKQLRRATLSDGVLEHLAHDAVALTQELDEQRQALKFCVERLTRRQRNLVDLFYTQRVPAGNVAKEWGCSVHTIYKTLKELRRRLFDCVSRRLGIDE